MTIKQKDAAAIRLETGASVDQIATWLNISRRAVLYRLRRSRQKTAKPPAPESTMIDMHRSRTYSASQIAGSAMARTLELDEL
jgi:orotate phosphoribosyltransferase-like protein